ncbi:MAG: prepilin peptidase [Candidatus Bathyarchaeota archaeon]|nr:prepilin peptidase [Candidatus Termiticorpusculum sp.]
MLSVLAYAAIFDFRCREVSNWVWILAYPIGCVMTLASLAFSLLDVQTVLISFLVSLFFGLVLFCLGFYGSADAKALLFLGLTLPTLPFTLNSTYGNVGLPLFLTVFCNAALLSLVWPLSIFILNLKDFLKGQDMFDGIKLSPSEKVWLLFTARKMPIEKLESLRYFPSETVEIEINQKEGTPCRKLLRFIKAEADLKKYRDNLKAHSELYQKGVLVSPTIPTMIFFTISLALTPLGNLFFFMLFLFGII